MNKHSSVLLCLCVIGCQRMLGTLLGDALSDPTLGISVERVEQGYLFRMRNCSNEDNLLDVDLIQVFPDVPRQEIRNTAPLCRVEFTQTKGNAILASWRYGEVPKGYESRGCQPLEPGRTYQIDIMPSGYMKFTLGPDGAIQSASPTCD